MLGLSPKKEFQYAGRLLERSLTVFVRPAGPVMLPFRVLVPLFPPTAPPPLLLAPCGMRRICSFMLTATCVLLLVS